MAVVKDAYASLEKEIDLYLKASVIAWPGVAGPWRFGAMSNLDMGRRYEVWAIAMPANA